MEISIKKVFRSVNVHKAAGINEFSTRFPKDGSQVLLKPINELCNLSIKLWSFPDIQKPFETTDHDINWQQFVSQIILLIGSNHTFQFNCLEKILKTVIQIFQIIHMGYKGPFWDCYCFSYMWMAFPKLINQICLYMLTPLT